MRKDFYWLLISYIYVINMTKHWQEAEYETNVWLSTTRNVICYNK